MIKERNHCKIYLVALTLGQRCGVRKDQNITLLLEDSNCYYLIFIDYLLLITGKMFVFDIFTSKNNLKKLLKNKIILHE
jgi:hypothetical protein